jgi:hypothetical protein
MFPSNHLIHLFIAIMVADRLCYWKTLLAGGHLPDSTDGEHKNMQRVFSMDTAVKISKQILDIS